MPATTIRRLDARDLAAYKALRDAMLAAHPDAFTSDALQEAAKPAEAYRSRLGLDPAAGDERIVLGAFVGDALVGSIGLERESRVKVRHLMDVFGMMVADAHRGRGIGGALLDAGIAEARRTPGVERLVLSVTASNAGAIRLYERAGFVAYGEFADAIRVDGRSLAKRLMTLALAG